MNKWKEVKLIVRVLFWITQIFKLHHLATLFFASPPQTEVPEIVKGVFVLPKICQCLNFLKSVASEYPVIFAFLSVVLRTFWRQVGCYHNHTISCKLSLRKIIINFCLHFLKNLKIIVLSSHLNSWYNIALC